jgi:hypothetical protein
LALLPGEDHALPAVRIVSGFFPFLPAKERLAGLWAPRGVDQRKIETD